MNHKKLIQEGEYMAEVNVELIYADEEWSPYLSLDDTQKLDEIREAMRRGDLKTAAKYRQVYSLTRTAL